MFLQPIHLEPVATPIFLVAVPPQAVPVV